MKTTAEFIKIAQITTYNTAYSLIQIICFWVSRVSTARGNNLCAHANY